VIVNALAVTACDEQDRPVTDHRSDATAALRACYLATAAVAVALVERPEVAARWDDDSALALMTVGDLAAHLARSVTLVPTFLDADEPAGDPIDAGSYYGRIQGLPDVSSDVNAGVRARSRDDAEPGATAVAARARAALTALTDRLPGVPEARLVSAFGGAVMPVDEYLRTRLVELTLHIDDLVRSLGLPDSAAPEAPTEAKARAVDVLVAAARVRHGDAAVLNALARRELDAVDALHVV